MKSRRTLKIDRIVLENFQSLRDRVEIPIRPLTFLFGPNSAGKSSIFDALCFVDSIFHDEDDALQKYFKRWAHVQTKNTLDEIKPVEKMTIEVRFSCFDFLLGGVGADLGDLSSLPEEFWVADGLKLLQKSEGPYEVKIEVMPTTFQHEKDGYVSPRLMGSFDITVSANGLKLMKLYDSDEEDSHEVEFFPEAFGMMFKKLADRHEVNFHHPKIFKAKCWPGNYGRGLEIQNDADNGSYDRDLIKIADHIIGCFSHSNFVPENVSSDRKTIPNAELSEFFNFEWHAPKTGLPFRFINAPLGAVDTLNTQRTGSIHEISKSKFFELGNKLSNESVIDSGEPLYEFVNRCLSHHLFLDQGYQIAFDVCKLNSADGDGLKDSYVALVVAHLIDNSGRRMTFEDVGTGISCVLPVLVAMHGQQSFVQQPELHLHPALQSALGDILVESVNAEVEGRHIIETHSDYLLLRCLRRIRETSNNKISKESKLRLKPTDVSILYFDPQSDGATTIKKIRVSTQGDFIDRWPRGFFEERGRDIFDE